MPLIPLQWIRQRNIFVGHLLFLMFEMFNSLPMSYCFCRKEFTLFSMWYCFCSEVFTLFFLQWGVYLIFSAVRYLPYLFCSEVFTLFSMSYCFCGDVYIPYFQCHTVSVVTYIYLIFNVVLFLWWRIYTLFSMSYCFCSEVSLWDTGSISPASLSLSSGNIKTQHSFPNYNSGNWLFLT